MKNLRICVLFLLITTIGLSAQISHGGVPFSFTEELNQDIQVREMPSVDIAEMKAIDEEFYMEKGRSMRFGKEHMTNFGLLNSGTWTELENGDRVWRVEILCPEAEHINLIYDDFYLPRGAKLFLYSADRGHVLGAFTSGNNKSYGSFSSGFVSGELTTLEYYEPADVEGQGRINISTVVHAYRNIIHPIGYKGYDDSGSCNVNVVCPEGDGWENQVNAVVKITSGGFDVCTGTMINNTRNDCTPYFVSAEHCNGNTNSWMFWFNYKSPTCQNADPGLNESVSGGTQRAAHAQSDMLLLELSSEPPVDYDVYYVGWNNADVASPTTTTIHHPSGDVMKISFNDDQVTSESGFGGAANTHWYIDNWESGTTEGGSSGSALFDEDKRIVGFLTGGAASCFNIAYDIYGKLAMAWEPSATSGSQLKAWLDPDDSGVTVLDGRSCSVELPVVDLGVEILSPIGENCDWSQTPEFLFQNNGITPITVMAFQYHIDNNADISEVWTGSLASLQSETIQLEQFITEAGEHTLTVCITNINGLATDDDGSNNCQQVSFSCETVSGIDDAAADILVYPNPASEWLVVELDAKDTADLALYDASGKQVFAVNEYASGSQLQLPSTLSNGVYLLRVNADQKQLSQKINLVR